nr:PREDICTED: protein D2-like [Bemisia tabaci]
MVHVFVHSVVQEKALFRENDEMPELGNVLDPNYLDWYPYLLNWPCDNTSLYTLVMTDPDSPSKYKPKMREWQHWLVGNIHVAVEEGDFLPDVFESDMMSKYIPPYPKKGTGFHRIVFLVYKQPMGRIEFKEKLLSYKARDSERANFSTRSFAKKYNLGDPIAVSFFLCQWVKPLPTTTAETWELPTEYWDDGNMLNPDMG